MSTDAGTCVYGTMLIVIISLLLPHSLLVRPAAADPLKFFVSKQGNDAWSGKLAEAKADASDGPFATLHRARDAVRELKQDRGLQQPVVVEVGGGTYYFDEPLVLGPKDSGTEQCPITYRAAEDERVVLSGGRPIDGPWRTNNGKIFYTEIPDVKSGDWFFRQLRIDDRMQTRCRHPNRDPQKPYDSGWLHAASPCGGADLGINMAMGLGQLQRQGTWLQYEIDVPADGSWQLRVLYANNGASNKKFFGFTDMSERTSVTIDGGEPVPVDDLPETGSFYSGFRWARAATLNLSAGKHTFRWVNTKGGALSLLAFLLTDDKDWQPPLPDSAANRPVEGHVVAWNAEDYDRKHGDLVGTHYMVDRKNPVFRTNLQFFEGDIKRWDHLDDAEVYVIPEYDWVSELLRVTDIDYKKRVVHLKGNNAIKPIFPHNRYYIANVLAVLDRPGEWCLVTDEGRLYVYSDEGNLQQQDVVAPRLQRVIELRGNAENGTPVSNIVLEGFTFSDARFTAPQRVEDVYHVNDGAVWLVRATDCRIIDNTFTNIGGYGVWLHDASRDNAIVENEFTKTGQGGVYLDGYRRNTYREKMPRERRPSHNLVAGNHIHHCGLMYAHVSGVYAVVSGNNVIAHNYVHHMPRYGISLKDHCPDNLVQYNAVRFTNLLTRDTGAIEMACNMPGSTVRYNLVTDAIGSGFVTSKAAHASPADACGIYLDNISSNNTVRGNIVTRCSAGLWMNMGGNNVIENNIFYNNRDSQALLNLPRGDHKSHGTNFVRRNIMVSTRPEAILYRIGAWKAETDDLRANNNCIWAGANTTPPMRGIRKNNSWKAWTNSGQDTESILAAPQFESPQKDEFGIPAHSPARKIGFKSIPTDRIGLAGYSADLVTDFIDAAKTSSDE